MTTFVCVACGTGLRPTAKFCDECGSPIAATAPSAEYKQVTVLFADVVHSMDIAAAVGPERLREIMTDLVTAAAAVVQRFGGTVDKFTGDGIMAVFGAPVALEDHAFRACLAALGIQDAGRQLAPDVTRRDGIALQLRVGLNSGQVIAGEIGAGALGYTAVGEQVGMAQRMEAAAPPGGVMLSESTARLVEHNTVLSEPELVRIKGGAEVPARRLIAATSDHHRRNDPQLVGRGWELSSLTALLDEAIGGTGRVIGVVGPPGIGKSRIGREAATLAAARGARVFTTYCESHTSDIPFHAVSGLLRAALGVDGLTDQQARAQIRTLVKGADPEDLRLLDDLLGVRDPATELPDIEADARRRRLTALVNDASLARTDPALFVIEDAHWIDAVSESRLAEFLTVIPQTPSMVLITYRPGYQGALTKIPGMQTISLQPLSTVQTTTLIGELLGTDPSVLGLAEVIVERAAGNPFFAEEIVRDLSERRTIRGDQGAYLLDGEIGDVSVPATLHAAIAARVDRLSSAAKRTLNAAAIIGSRFGPELLAALGTEPVLDELVAGELIDQVGFIPKAEYAFRHPLIRTVAYESQLKADRAELHRRLAAAIERQGSADENAALIAEHHKSAGDLPAAFTWYMRAGTWLTHRDLAAARASWQHARDVADRLPEAVAQRVSMRIAPRTLLCATAWLVGGSLADIGFHELRDLTLGSDDKVSLAVGMSGWVPALISHNRLNEASRLASELVDLLDSIDDPTLTLGLLYAAYAAKVQVGEFAEALRLTQRAIDLADGDITKGNLILGSPLLGAMMLRGCTRSCLGDPRWREDMEQSLGTADVFDVTLLGVMLLFKYSQTVTNGARLLDAAARRETAEFLSIAERSAGNVTLGCARYVQGLALLMHDGPERAEGIAMLAAVREEAVRERFTMAIIGFIDTNLANEKIRVGDFDGAIETARAGVDTEYKSGEMTVRAAAVAALVEALLRRGGPTDLPEAQAAIDRLAGVSIEPGFVMTDIWLLRMRALMAQARGDAAAYRGYRDQYREMANSLGLEGHIGWAAAMS